MGTVPSRAELIRLIKEAGTSLKTGEFLPKMGGAAAAGILIGLLQNEPDPTVGPKDDLWSAFAFRQNLIGLLRELGDPSAVEPLEDCYETYKLMEDLAVHTLSTAETTVPARYGELELLMLWKEAGSPAAAQTPGYSLFKYKISESHLKSSIESPSHILALLLLGGTVRLDVLKALEKIQPAASREFFARVLKEDRNRTVWRGAVLIAGRLRDPAVIEELHAFLLNSLEAADVTADQVREAIDLLAAYSEPRARQVLQDYYNKATARTQREYRLRAGARLGLNPEPKAEKSKCFIATAACGSADASEVVLLRRFREQRLRPYRAGRVAIALYERLSPPLADLIRPRPWLRAGVRAVLIRPLVRGIEVFLPVRTAGGANGVECARSD